MNKILKKLTLWMEAGLLSQSQLEEIVKFEEENRPKNIAAYSVITLGATVICLGIISLIASNWKYIPDLIKIFLDLFMLTGLSLFIFKNKDSEKKWLLETLLISYFILILASIGLISQIYHTGGEFYQATTFWCVITLPIVLFSTGRATIHIWFIAAIFSITATLLDRVISFKEENILIAYTYSFLPAFLLCISYPLQSTKKESLEAFGKVSRFWSTFGFLTGSVFFSILGILKFNQSFHSKEILIGLLLISCILNGVSIYFTFLNNRKLSILLLIALSVYTIMFSSHVFEFNSKFLDVFLFILIWFSVGFIFHILESKRLFEFAIIVIGLRFLVAYFQLFTSLIFTAFGLIFSGILIILVCVLYLKNRDKISRWIGELI